MRCERRCCTWCDQVCCLSTFRHVKVNLFCYVVLWWVMGEGGGGRGRGPKNADFGSDLLFALQAFQTKNWQCTCSYNCKWKMLLKFCWKMHFQHCWINLGSKSWHFQQTFQKTSICYHRGCSTYLSTGTLLRIRQIRPYLLSICQTH